MGHRYWVFSSAMGSSIDSCLGWLEGIFQSAFLKRWLMHAYRSEEFLICWMSSWSLTFHWERDRYNVWHNRHKVSISRSCPLVPLEAHSLAFFLFKSFNTSEHPSPSPFSAASCSGVDTYSCPSTQKKICPISRWLSVLISQDANPIKT